MVHLIEFVYEFFMLIIRDHTHIGVFIDGELMGLEVTDLCLRLHVVS